LADLFVALAEQPAFVRTAEAQGWADAATQAALRAAVRAWGERPDAYYAIVYAEAIGWVGPAEAAPAGQTGEA
jgi:hypothetical protein